MRPVINMSGPKGRSFNDAVATDKLEKVHMTTAQQFGYKVRKAGRHSLLSKFDLRDAYKLVPARKQDWRLQGFQWLGKWFVETQMVFGAIPAVASFDQLGHTILDLTLAKCSIPANLTGRCLDDVPIVAPRQTGWCEAFSAEYQATCKRLNVKLAEECPKNEKAFVNQTRGTVLGVTFDTNTLRWSLSTEKADEATRTVLGAIGADTLSLLQVQVLLGTVNDIAQMCPFLKGFRRPANQYLASFEGNSGRQLAMPAQVKADMTICLKAIQAAREGLPIPRQPREPSLEALCFTSDAAGAAFSMINGAGVPVSGQKVLGAASVGLRRDKTIWYVCRVTWPARLLNEARDSKGCYYGSKTTTLEAIGVLLPLLTIPAALAGREVVLKVDNLAVVYGWANKGVKFDEPASIIIRALHMIASYLGCTVHVKHLPRKSTTDSDMADRMTRKDTLSKEDEILLRALPTWEIPQALLDWLDHPEEDWSLANRLLATVKDKVPM